MRIRSLLPAVLTGALWATAGPVAAQDTTAGLAAECAEGGDALRTALCTETALRAQAARAGVGLLAAGGNDLPGTAGTLGVRGGGVPRLSLAARLVGSSLPHAGLPSTTGPDPLAPAEDYFATGLHAAAGLGVFDGFSPAPTVGGLLSLDLVATGSFLFLPAERGFDSDERLLGLGARVGILRESFTLPGVTLTAHRRWGGEHTLSWPGGGDAASWDLTATSLRGTVGKDLLGVGLLLGAGWDRYEGPLSIAVPDGAGGAWDAAGPDVVDDRSLYFGGASLNLLVLQLSAELGWARGFDSVPGRAAGGYDPESGSWFGSLAARLTY